jgi:uncharacterized protein (TIGR00369 family)
MAGEQIAEMTIQRARKKSPKPALAMLAERELAQRLHASNTARQFGFLLQSAGPGRAVIRMRVRARHKQVHGVVHGGVLAALADTAGGLATYMCARRGTRVATAEMKMNYLEPVSGGTVIADARVIRKGRNLAVVDCDLHEESGALVGKALMTFSMGRMR